MLNRILSVILLCIAAGTFSADAAHVANSPAAARAELGRPDLDSIASATTDENSPYFYPRLLKRFMANDSAMTSREFQYFYYGTLFREDYDPYRASPNQGLLDELAPIYAKAKRTRSDREKMLDYSTQALADNPVDLRQLTNRIFVYEQNHKYDLAKIWQYKLNPLLLVIASSGTGLTQETAWIVVYPQHEYDFLNLSGLTATGQTFRPPFYDYISVQRRNDSTPEGYFFDIKELLRQYFAKHPEDIEEASRQVEETAAEK